MPVQLVLTNDELEDAAEQLAAVLALPVQRQAQPVPAGYVVGFGLDGVSLALAEQSNMAAVRVDFTQGGAAHRRKFGGGSGQMVAKAVGIQGSLRPQVLDATAGLGGDAFVLACLGCEVTLLERSPIVHALLADGLRRAKIFAEQADYELLEILQRMQLLAGDSIQYLAQPSLAAAQVIYLDPMFPERQKTAAVKKEMQLFHGLLGVDVDDHALLQAALDKAIFRVAVKRPRLAPPIGDRRVNLVLEGKSCRYDIYTHKKITREALADNPITP